MSKTSVITPSIRPEFLDITQFCLEKQTDKDFDWLVEIGLRNNGFRLPSDMNKALKRAGDIVIILQDCIRVPDNFIEYVKKLDLKNKAYTFPVSKVKSWGDDPVHDWRYTRDGRIAYREWETDLAVAPLKMFKDIGGYDEDFNNGWSWDNVEVACRAEFAGYEFFCNNKVLGTALDHDFVKENPFRNKRENNDKRAEHSRLKAINGEWKLSYLVDEPLLQKGEIADRYTIVKLKKERLDEAEFTNELSFLSQFITEDIQVFINELYKINGAIWDLESDIRKGKDGELGLEEIGSRAIKIRDLNKQRISVKNEITKKCGGFKEIKVEHASS